MGDDDAYRQERRTFRSLGQEQVAAVRDRLAELPATPDEELRGHVAELARPSRSGTVEDLVRLADCRHARPDGARCVCAVAFADERSWQQIMDAGVLP